MILLKYPKVTGYTIHPKLFIYPNETTTIIVGNSLTTQERTGGDVQVIQGKASTEHQIF